MAQGYWKAASKEIVWKLLKFLIGAVVLYGVVYGVVFCIGFLGIWSGQGGTWVIANRWNFYYAVTGVWGFLVLIGKV